MAQVSAFVIVFGLMQLAIVLACNCNLKHPQTQYKEGKFVIRAKVLEKKNSQPTGSSILIDYVEYVVKVERVFKGKTKKFGISPQTVASIFTADSSFSCGLLSLKPGRKYLISGSFVSGSLQISQCDWVEEWKDITTEQKKGLKAMYRRHCEECEVPAVSGGQLLMQIRRDDSNAPAPLNELVSVSGLWNSNGRCMYNPIDSWQYNSPDCETKYTVCMKKEAGHCGWENNEAYTKCFTKREVQWVKRSLSNPFRGRSLRIGNLRIGCSDVSTAAEFEECLEREVYRIVTQNLSR